VFIYVWTWVIVIGSRHTERGQTAHLRDFLHGSCWLAVAVSFAIAGRAR
jgi:hypothetical protein